MPVSGTAPEDLAEMRAPEMTYQQRKAIHHMPSLAYKLACSKLMRQNLSKWVNFRSAAIWLTTMAAPHPPAIHTLLDHFNSRSDSVECSSFTADSVRTFSSTKVE